MIRVKHILSKFTKTTGVIIGLATMTIVANSTTSLAAERTWTDIGSLGSSPSTYDINDHGIVVGDSRVTGHEYHAFVWQDGTMQDIGTSGENSTARDINNHGQVIGYRYPGDDSIPFVWHNGQMHDLTLPTDRATVNDINDNGKIVGTLINDDDRTPFVYDIATNELAELEDYGDAYGINNHDQVVGTRFVDGQRQATLWSSGETIDLGALPPDYPNSVATHINDNGHITGWLADGYYWTQRAFYWQDGVMQEIGPTPLGAWNIPRGLNNHNQVLGSHYEGDGELVWPWLWENGEDELLSTEEWQFGYGNGINNAGQIIVDANHRSYVSSATSIPPEPTVTVDTIMTKVEEWQHEGKLTWIDSVLMQAFLRQAKSQIESGDTSPACLRLDMVIGQIDSLEQQGKLNSQNANELRGDVEIVASSIGCNA